MPCDLFEFHGPCTKQTPSTSFHFHLTPPQHLYPQSHKPIRCSCPVQWVENSLKPNWASIVGSNEMYFYVIPKHRFSYQVTHKVQSKCDIFRLRLTQSKIKFIPSKGQPCTVFAQSALHSPESKIYDFRIVKFYANKKWQS